MAFRQEIEIAAERNHRMLKLVYDEIIFDKDNLLFRARMSKGSVKTGYPGGNNKIY